MTLVLLVTIILYSVGFAFVSSREQPKNTEQETYENEDEHPER